MEVSSEIKKEPELATTYMGGRKGKGEERGSACTPPHCNKGGWVGVRGRTGRI